MSNLPFWSKGKPEQQPTGNADNVSWFLVLHRRSSNLWVRLKWDAVLFAVCRIYFSCTKAVSLFGLSICQVGH